MFPICVDTIIDFNIKRSDLQVCTATPKKSLLKNVRKSMYVGRLIQRNKGNYNVMTN